MHTQILNNILPAKLLNWIILAALTIEFSLHERHEWFWLITMQCMLIKCSRTPLLKLINPLYSTSRQNKQSSNWIVVLKTTTAKLLVNKHWWQDTEVSCHFNILVGPLCIAHVLEPMHFISWIEAKYKPSTLQELYYLNFDLTKWVQEKICQHC